MFPILYILGLRCWKAISVESFRWDLITWIGSTMETSRLDFNKTKAGIVGCNWSHEEDKLTKEHSDRGEELGQKSEMGWGDGGSRKGGGEGLVKKGRRIIRRVWSHGSKERKQFKKQGVTKSCRRSRKIKLNMSTGFIDKEVISDFNKRLTLKQKW